MANEELLRLLRASLENWNRWRKAYPAIEVDLRNADLSRADLSRADLSGADLRETDFREANLSEANLSGTKLSGAKLRKADLRRAFLNGANLTGADLTGADLVSADLSGASFTYSILSGADLSGADFNYTILSGANLSGAKLRAAKLRKANLRGADLREANLREAIFSRAALKGADLSKAMIADTIYGSSDLSEVIGLEAIVHDGPSIILTDTFALSKGNIPEAFLRGCGLADWEIEAVKLHSPNLSNEEINRIIYKMYDLRATQALQISPLFVSYSHADGEFVDKVGDKLTKKGIRYWRDIHDMKAGRLERQIDRAIRQNPTVLLVLSEHSLESDWVEHEVRTARGFEKEIGHDTLCPVALDDSWKSSRWPKRIMEQIKEYNILDFSKWEDHSVFDKQFKKLLDGLDLFYK